MGPSFPRLYGTGTGADVRVPLLKRAVVDFAIGADWTPAAGDVKVSKDGGASANIATLPTALAMGNTALWVFVLSDAELQCKELQVTVADAATKAVEDQSFSVVTYGHASAMFAQNFATTVTQTGDAFARLGAPVGASLSADVAAVQADTDNLQTRIPATLVSGRIDASIGAIAAGAITAAAIATDAIDADALAADAVTELQAGLSTLTAAGIRAAIGLASANLDTQLADLPTNAELVIALAAADDTVLAALAALNNLSQAGVRAAVGLASANLDIQLSAIDDFLDTEIAALVATLGVAGAGLTALGDARLAHLDADVSSRSTFAGGAVASVTGAVGSVTGNVGGNVAGSVGSVVAPVAITSNVKQGQALASIPFLMTDATSHEPMSGLTVVVQRKIDNGAYGVGTLSGITGSGSGTYTVDAATGDMNGKIVTFRATATGADDTYWTLFTQP